MSDFKSELEGLPAKLEEVGKQYAEAKKAEALAKFAKEKTASELDTMARESLGGEKKPTEAAIANWVKSHPSMQTTELQLIEVSFEADKVRATLEGLRAKKDILLALVGGNDGVL